MKTDTISGTTLTLYWDDERKSWCAQQSAFIENSEWSRYILEWDQLIEQMEGGHTRNGGKLYFSLPGHRSVDEAVERIESFCTDWGVKFISKLKPGRINADKQVFKEAAPDRFKRPDLVEQEPPKMDAVSKEVLEAVKDKLTRTFTECLAHNGEAAKKKKEWMEAEKVAVSFRQKLEPLVEFMEENDGDNDWRAEAKQALEPEEVE